jgi:hypothetical protein
MSKLITPQEFANSLLKIRNRHIEADNLREITFTARYTMINSSVYEEETFTIQVPRSYDGYAVDAIKKDIASKWVKSRIQIEVSELSSGASETNYFTL